MLYTHYNALEEIPESIQKQLQDKYFKSTFAEDWRETVEYFVSKGSRQFIPNSKANRNPSKNGSSVSLVFCLHRPFGLCRKRG